MPKGIYLGNKGRIPWNKGRKGVLRTSEETKDKIRSIAKEKGFGKWMKGRFHSLETRKKMSDNRKKENNSFWKGGFTYLQKLENIAGRKRPELCEICGKKGKICFDHNHETGKFRGWICVKCNIACR